MADLSYRVILEPAEEGGYLVRVPAFPHIYTEGDDRDEALRMAVDAIELELSYPHRRRTADETRDRP